MKLVQYVRKSQPGEKLLGVVLDNGIVNLNYINPDIGNDLKEVLTTQKHLLDALHSCYGNDDIMKMARTDSFDTVQLLAPIEKPDKVLCIGMNYKDHCEEQNVPVPKEPMVFNKFPSCLCGPYDEIEYPSITQELDYEVELAFVIGKKCKDVEPEKAMEHVLGYTVANDLSAREWQLKKNGGQWLVGKAMDQFCPIGPYIVTKEEIPDPHNLTISCKVNGVTKQSSNTSQMVHTIDNIVSFLSKLFTLYPGDIVVTGTPPGVGVFQHPPFFLKRGDVVECSIENIGAIKNIIK